MSTNTLTLVEVECLDPNPTFYRESVVFEKLHTDQIPTMGH